MVRNILVNGFIAVHSMIFCLWGIFLSFFWSGRTVHFKCAVPWAKTILRVCGVKVRVNGLENIDPGKPGIYLSNHQSYFDIFILLACLPVDFKFLLKQELMKIPLLGRAVRGAEYVAIDREDPRKALRSIKEAAERIRGGASLLIFPEGTRSEDGGLQPYKKGGFRLALKAGCDVIPIGIIGSCKIVPKGTLRFRPGNVTMNVGKPVPAGGYSKRDMDQLMGRLWEDMKDLIQKGPSE
jgi:1-acyl-sn-glycerol-3-phosphate acyltransferase